MKWFWWQFLAGGVVGGIMASAAVQAKELSLETRVFPVGKDFWVLAEEAKAANELFASRPPSLRTPLEQWETFRLNGNFQSAEKALTQLGIKFPKGASAVFHPAACTLTMRNTAPNMHLMEAMLAGEENRKPKTMTFTAHLVQAPGPLLRLLAANEAQKMDQTQALRDLMNEAEKGSGAVKILHTAYMDLSRGSQSTFSSGTEHEHANELILDAKGRAQVEASTQPLGFELDLDSFLSADGRSLDVRAQIQHRLLKQPPRQENLTEPVSGGPLQMPLAEFEEASISTEVKMKSGHTRMLGMWPVKNDPAVKAADVSQGVFLTAHVLSHGTELPERSSIFVPSPNQMVEKTLVLPREFFMVNPEIEEGEMLDILEVNGLKLPSTTQVSLDEQRRLRIKTTAEMMPVVEGWAMRYVEMFPPTLKYTAEVIRAPAAMIRQQILSVAHQSNHKAMLNVLNEAVARKEAEQVTVAFAETRPTERASLESVLDKHGVSELSWQSGQQPVMETQRRPAGFRLHLDSYLSRGGSLVDVGILVERHYGLPRARQEKLSDPASRRSFIMPLNAFDRSRIETQVILSAGETRLIGVWCPMGNGGAVEDDVLEAVFVRCDVSRHTRHFEVAEDHAGAGGVTSPSKDDDKMLTKVFKLAPDFIFHQEGSPKMFPDPLGRELSAKDFFKAQGIPFPEGAEMIYQGPITGQLLVKNTAINLALMEAYFKKLNGREPSDINFILHLLEVPAAKVNEMFLRAELPADHRAVLDMLLSSEGKDVKSLATLNLSARGKHAHTVENVQQLQVFKSIRMGDEGSAKVERETMAVGTSLKVEVDNEADERLLKVDYEVLHHPAEPIRYAVNLAAEGSAPVEVPLTDLPVEKVKGHLLMMSGSAQILALWKPMGRPEYDAGNLYHLAILEAHVVQEKKPE